MEEVMRHEWHGRMAMRPIGTARLCNPGRDGVEGSAIRRRKHIARTRVVIGLAWAALVFCSPWGLPFEPSAPVIQAAEGDLDSTFGTGGKVTTDFSGSRDYGQAVAIQSDGKIVVAGFAFYGTYDFALARYDTNGALDSTFGTGGKVTTDFGGTADYAWAVAIQSDGKIVAVGMTGNPFDFALARYNTDGSLDTTFGADGKVITDFGGSYDWATGVAIQSDGKIVVVGVSIDQANFALARYNTDGSLDTTFGAAGNGKVSTNFSGKSDQSLAVAIQSDGKIVVAGNSGRYPPPPFYDFAVARYNTDGTLDSGFGSSGKVTTNFSGSYDTCLAVAIQSDGKIVAVGDSDGNDFALARYDTNGALDSTFGTGGKVTTDFSGGQDQAYAVAIQSDGKIVAVGTSKGDSDDFMLARYETDGTSPATTISLNPFNPNGLNGWYRSDVHATVSAADNVGGSGVAETRCVLDPLSAPASFDAIPAGCAYAGADVITDGQHTLYAASKDNGGNKETPVSKAFKIDKTPPSLAITLVAAPANGFMPTLSFASFPATVGAQPVTLSGTVSDAGSGVASVTVQGGPATVGSGTWSKNGLALAVGANTLQATATDAAGNTLVVPVSVTLNLDLDGDGIANNVDGNSTVSPAVSQALVASSRFSDKALGGGTSGRISLPLPGGISSVKVTDAPNPAGVTVVVTGLSGNKATLTVDGKAGNLKLAPGTYTVTDPAGEITIATLVGGPAEVDYTLNGTPVVILIGTGAIATITETTSGGTLTDLRVQPTGTGLVTLNGGTLPVGRTIAIGTLSGKLSNSEKSFSYEGTFTPAASSNGVNPRTEEVSLKIGSYTFLISAGLFKGASDDGYAFSGTVGGVKLTIELKRLKGGKWKVEANGKPVSGLRNSAPVSLRIGDDAT